MKKHFLEIVLVAFLCFLWTGFIILPGQEKKDQDANEKIWKKLDKSVIPGGLWIGNTGRYKFFSLQKGIHMKEIRQLLERVRLNEQVSIELVLDFGAVVDLGTYQPTIEKDEKGRLQVRFDSILNLKEVETNATYKEFDLYKLIFKNAEGKVKATIMVRLTTV